MLFRSDRRALCFAKPVRVMPIYDEDRIERLLCGIAERLPQQGVKVRIADKQYFLSWKVMDPRRLRRRPVDPNDQGGVGAEERRDVLGEERPQRKLPLG